MNAITKTQGPCVVLAGAGTGKTYTIVEKIRHLIANKIYAPERIVCITFSNEAANNLLTRVQKFVNLENGKEPIIKTFHSFSAELLRKYGDKIGMSKEFNILDPDEAKIVLHRNFKVNGYNCHRYISSIGTAKDLGITIEQLKSHLTSLLNAYKGIDIDREYEQINFEFQTLHLKKDNEKKRFLLDKIKKLTNVIELRKFIGAWEAYEKIKKKKNYQDYSDLNNNALLLLKKNPEIANDFDYIIVDEFQDTNKVQLELLVALAVKKNITVVGDLNQSIYRFRGAYRENFSLFRHHFSVTNCDIFNLDKSFRSPNKVLRTAHRLILNNYENKNDCFIVENNAGREGEEISVFELKNGKEEARKITEIVESELKKGVPAEEICVMFRTHQQGRIIRRALDFKNIKYCSVSKESLLKQRSVKQIIDYLVILDKLARKAKGGEQEFWDLLYNLNFIAADLVKIGRFIKDYREDQCICETLLNDITSLELSESGKTSARVIVDKIKELLSSKDKPLVELLNEVYRVSGLLRRENLEEFKEVQANLNRFFELAKNHSSLYEPDLYSFLNYLEVIETLGIEIKAAELEKEGIRLMTLHATKGLEYKTVIVTNMAQKRFPMEKYSTNSLIPIELYPELAATISATEDVESYSREYERKNQLLDERRLCYVAFTRTKEKLILTYALDYGNKKFFPSQFLNEIGFKENLDIRFAKDEEEKYSEPEIAITPASQFGKALASNDFETIVNEVAKQEINAPEKIVFSPSALLSFNECEKAYEYRYVYNMPEKKTISWEAMRLGSFVHVVLEQGVEENFLNYDDYLNLAREIHLSEDWESVDLNEALKMIKVFFERNKLKYNDKSKTELRLETDLEGYRFTGFADRIDFTDDGVDIVDYKTGRTHVPPKNRDWQLGYYALAAQKMFGKVRKVTLDMLRLEKPLEFGIDENGEAISVNGEVHFNIYDVESELVETAEKILFAYKHGFKPCPVEKNCPFCNEYVYRN
jgi:DNA helicase-2/ATP-dependent DNA helicase PcrA